MTSTQENTRPLPLIGPSVGLAQASLTRLLAGDLVAAGLAETGEGTIRLTAQGRGLREEVLAASAKITGPMLATIDRDDLETTVRTLDEITRRARGIPARPTTTEGNR
jgi:DNA-binding MarR family transcriptional regulator